MRPEKGRERTCEVEQSKEGERSSEVELITGGEGEQLSEVEPPKQTKESSEVEPATEGEKEGGQSNENKAAASIIKYRIVKGGLRYLESEDGVRWRKHMQLS